MKPSPYSFGVGSTRRSLRPTPIFYQNLRKKYKTFLKIFKIMDASTKIFLAFRLKIWKIDRKDRRRRPRRSSRNAPSPATFAKRRDFIKR